MADQPTDDELVQKVRELETAEFELKQAQQALRESETRFDAIFENSLDAILLTVPDGNVIAANPAACRMFGITEAEFRRLGRNGVIDTADPRLADALEERSRTGRYTGELTYIRKDGSRFVGEASSTIFQDRNGRDRSSLIIRDITGRKQAEDALRRSEAKYRTLFENMVQGVFYQRADGTLMDANQAAMDMFGLTAEEFYGRTSLDPRWHAIHEDGSEFPGHEHPSMQALQTGEPVLGVIGGVFNPIREDYVWLIVNAIPQFREGEDAPYQVFVTMHDITERKQAEMALRDSRERLAAELDVMKRLQHIGSLFVGQKSLPEVMQEIVETAIFITGSDMGNLQIYDPETDRLTIIAHCGFEQNWLDFWESVEAGQGACGTAIRQGGRVIVEDVTRSAIFAGTPAMDVQLAAGVRAVQSTPLIGRAGSPLGMLSTHFKTPHRPSDDTLRRLDLLVRQAADIIERARAEDERRRLESDLRQAQKMESIGTLAGGIAHDFNNILASMIGFTELALDEAPRNSSLEESLQEVYSAGIRARDLVKQILAFARKSDEKKSLFQPGLVAREVLKFIRSAIPATIDVRQHIASDAWILGNPTQIHQVFMNLCSNAAYAMEDAGGVLSLRMKNVVVEHQSSRIGLAAGDYVAIEVADTGVGIAPDIVESIFDPYFTTKGVGEGTGMGLALAHGVVESYGGRIYVDSELGKGTTFTVLLPTAKKGKPPAQYASEQFPSGSERILFVDDEAPLAKMVGHMLTGLGYSVTTRTSAIDALDLFRAKPADFDLVVTDMTMPTLSGDKLAIALIKIRRDLPVILCTGFSKKISDAAVSEAGIKALLLKPVVKADLARTVRKVLDEAKVKTRPQ